MRNPLSAMLMCADGIADSLKEFLALKEKTEIISEELVESNLDAAQTIVLCAQHQKRIIDDVLTLSKLKSAMLHVTPVQVQVEATVRRTLRMFESELLGHDIRMTFVVEPSFENANIDMVYCDPVRLTQIFINLLTNVSLSTHFLIRYIVFILFRLSNSRSPRRSVRLLSTSELPYQNPQKMLHPILNGFHRRTRMTLKI
jgi:K+-sensing histidine kinase KdpD